MIMAKKIAVIVLFSIGVYYVSTSGYMVAKSWLSQVLIGQAWQKTLKDHQRHKPWSWADAYPIAELSIPRLQKNRYILSGSSARNLAFAASHLPQSGLPDESKSMVISGHNDSHFAFLSDVKVGDKLYIKSVVKGQVVMTPYVVNTMNIVDSSQTDIQVLNHKELILVTCYPFDQLMTGTNWRYVVQAKPVNGPIG